ncbi:polyphosphate polymerase domain-containing protein [Planctomicrobium piriforme]|nr:polyphosphate polymerase domain-containing protein [Planctomicrobium piriforme]
MSATSVQATTMSCGSGTAFESPSLRCGVEQGASSEVKFLVSADLAAALELLLQDELTIDPHAAPFSDQRYQVRTLYTDTDAFAVFHRQGVHRHHKYRVRRYGDHSTVYLEQKSKTNGRVGKRRSAATLAELCLLTCSYHRSAEQDWFCRSVVEDGLKPVCEVAYERRPYFGILEGQPVRLTLDRQLRGRPAAAWSFDHQAEWRPLFADRMICELKFVGALPRRFKEAIAQLGMIPGGCSKYRHCVETLKLAERREPVDA